MKIPWRDEIFKGEEESALKRTQLCERLLSEGYCRDRTQGMELIAIALRDKTLVSSDDSIMLASAEKAEYKDSITLTAEQARAIQLVEQGHNFFVTGTAGTGKSHFIRELVRIERARRGKGVVFCTSLTAMSACELGATTLHSFAGLSGNGLIDIEQLSPAAIRRWRICELLVIDEVSMMPASLLEDLHHIATKLRATSSPFGRIQVVLVGDFAQTPPIGIGGEDVKFCFVSLSEGDQHPTDAAKRNLRSGLN